MKRQGDAEGKAQPPRQGVWDGVVAKLWGFEEPDLKKQQRLNDPLQ